MANINLEQSEITSLLDLEKTYGEWRFVKVASEREETNTEDETREVVAVRFDAISSIQGKDFRIEISLQDNPMVDLTNLEYYDPVEIVGMRVFSYNSNGQLVEKIRALDVKKKANVTNPPKDQSESLTNKKPEINKTENKVK
ncbi:DUF961 domain-containing protein [Enterococcus faecium]|uniref:DUF961 family protein n=1 Tax=Enterococcus faecium TaxID=1352 RepID=UPI0019243FDF|nr:DUF961 family protein [Enterococcus faecium]EME3581670.1 DUF961 family protein [Enterococcus faecium]MBL3708500.1 DUF961 domain-containing protein [Enterococcus faecium]